MDEKEKIVLEAVIEKDGKKMLTCPKAFEISEKNNISLSDIGKICNKNRIKMTKCQLGCF